MKSSLLTLPWMRFSMLLLEQFFGVSPIVGVVLAPSRSAPNETAQAKRKRALNESQKELNIFGLNFSLFPPTLFYAKTPQILTFTTPLPSTLSLSSYTPRPPPRHHRTAQPHRTATPHRRTYQMEQACYQVEQKKELMIDLFLQLFLYCEL